MASTSEPHHTYLPLPVMAGTVEVAAERYAAWRTRFDQANPDGPQRILAVDDGLPGPLAVVLVRRGGYAVGLTDAAGHLTASKVGTRYVQSRTAAGGWSQQRFARRRKGQADALTTAVAEHVVRIVPRGIPASIALGGDKALIRDVLADPRLSGLGDLPRREFYDIADPRRSVLEDVVRRAQSVRVSIDDGP